MQEVLSPPAEAQVKKAKPQATAAYKVHRRAGAPTPTFETLLPANRTDFQVEGGPYDDYLRRVRAAVGPAMHDAIFEADRPGPMLDLLLAAHAVPYSVMVGKVEVPLAPEAIMFARDRSAGRVAVKPDEWTRRHINDDLDGPGPHTVYRLAVAVRHGGTPEV